MRGNFTKSQPYGQRIHVNPRPRAFKYNCAMSDMRMQPAHIFSYIRLGTRPKSDIYRSGQPGDASFCSYVKRSRRMIKHPCILGLSVGSCGGPSHTITSRLHNFVDWFTVNLFNFFSKARLLIFFLSNPYALIYAAHHVRHHIF